MSISTKAGMRPALIFLALLAGCAGAPVTPTPGAVDTGTFPNLNIKPQSAAVQISPAEKASAFGQLGAAKNAQAAAGATAAPPTDPLLLKKIASKHGDDTLKQIAGQQ